jgi:hypothetical protein
VEHEPEVVTLDNQSQGEETQLHRSNKIWHAPLRYQLLMDAENDKLLMINESTNYIEAISDINSKKIA